jgi:hypothetical protein
LAVAPDTNVNSSQSPGAIVGVPLRELAAKVVVQVVAPPRIAVWLPPLYLAMFIVGVPPSTKQDAAEIVTVLPVSFLQKLWRYVPLVNALRPSPMPV